MKKNLTIIATIVLLFTTSIFAQKAEPNRIKFAKGKTSATVSGTLSDDEEMDFVFGARAGQNVTLNVTSEPKGYLFDFTLMGDGFDFQTELDSYYDYEFSTPETGDYLVTVRKRPTDKNKTAKFFLTLTIK